MVDGYPGKIEFCTSELDLRVGVPPDSMAITVVAEFARIQNRPPVSILANSATCQTDLPDHQTSKFIDFECRPIVLSILQVL